MKAAFWGRLTHLSAVVLQIPGILPEGWAIGRLDALTAFPSSQRATSAFRGARHTGYGFVRGELTHHSRDPVDKLGVDLLGPDAFLSAIEVEHAAGGTAPTPQPVVRQWQEYIISLTCRSSSADCSVISHPRRTARLVCPTYALAFGTATLLSKLPLSQVLTGTHTPHRPSASPAQMSLAQSLISQLSHANPTIQKSTSISRHICGLICVVSLITHRKD